MALNECRNKFILVAFKFLILFKINAFKDYPFKFIIGIGC